jgi:hypothetical protein
MRNVFLALLTALVFLLGACGTTTPTPNKPATEEPAPNNGDNGGNGGDNGGGDAEPTDNTGGGNTGGGNNGGGNTGGGNTGGGNTGGTTPPAPVYDPSLMKGFLANYKGSKPLTVKSLWVDQSNGQIVDFGTDPMARLETNGEFGVRLGTPADAALATLPLPITCGTLTTTTVPAGLTSVKGALVPALFVFDGSQLVGLIIHGSYHVDDKGNIIPQAKLAMRVYSATDKIISKGECSGSVSANALQDLNVDSISAAIEQFGVSSPAIDEALSELTMLSTPAGTATLTVDVGLKKGWNTVVLGATADLAAGTLDVTLIDDTQPNFTWYYLDLTQF